MFSAAQNILSSHENALPLQGATVVCHAESEEGKVINIYSWNDEFRTRLEAIYPEVESTSSDGTVTTLKDGTEIHWIINPNQDGVYQQKLDEALLNQADASADDKVDIFLSETDYVFKYTDKDADVAMPLTDLGIDPDTDLADQYDFTRTTASDSDGVQRGSTWQCCPGTLVYRRDIAKEVFGTDDPAEVQKKVADWDTFKATAEELKEKGIWFVCADMGGEIMYDLDLTGPMGLVIGNEGEGVSRLVRENCDFTATIPMKGDIDSLNASVAAGVLAYEIVRQRSC